MRRLATFTRFWWDFIVGDSVMLAVGGAAVLILGAFLVSLGANALAELTLPVAVTVTLALSLRSPP